MKIFSEKEIKELFKILKSTDTQFHFKSLSVTICLGGAGIDFC